jgi:hypothetical protein
VSVPGGAARVRLAPPSLPGGPFCPFLPKELRFEVKPRSRAQTSRNRSSKDKQLLTILVPMPVSLTICALYHQWLRGGAGWSSCNRAILTT